MDWRQETCDFTNRWIKLRILFKARIHFGIHRCEGAWTDRSKNWLWATWRIFVKIFVSVTKILMWEGFMSIFYNMFPISISMYLIVFFLNIWLFYFQNSKTWQYFWCINLFYLVKNTSFNSTCVQWWSLKTYQIPKVQGQIFLVISLPFG